MREAPIKQILLAGTFLIAASAPAFALDSDDFIAKVKAAYDDAGITFTHGDIQTKGDSALVIKDVVFSPSAEISDELEGFEQKQPVEVSFSDIQENEDGSYVVGELLLKDATFMAEDLAWTIGSYEEHNLHIPATPDMSNPSGWLYGENSQVEDVTLDYKGETILSMPSAEGMQTFDAETQTAGFTAKTGDISLDLTNVDDLDPDFRNYLETLDLLKSTSTFDLAGTWNIVSGDLDVSSYNLSVEDVGTLKVSFGITGFTLDMLNTLDEMPDDVDEDATASEDGMDPYQEQMMELGQQIGVSGLSIRFEDDSITRRLMQLMEDDLDVTTEEVVTDINNDINTSLSALNMPDLANMVTSAVETYFNDPQSFEVSIAPQMQMPVLAIFMAGAAAPQSVPQLLNLEIKAND